MNFDIFESIVGSGSVSVLSAAFLGLFVTVVLIRIGITVNSQFNLVSKEQITFGEFLKYTLLLLVFLIIVIAFIQSL